VRLEAIDEQDVHDGSDGFRPARSPQAALHAWREQGRTEGIGGIVDADVTGISWRMSVWTNPWWSVCVRMAMTSSPSQRWSRVFLMKPSWPRRTSEGTCC